MKKKNVFILSIVSFFTVIVFSSCQQDEVDVTKPTITLHSPKDHAVLAIGDEHGIHFDVEFEDDTSLASYKVNIHAAFDGHDHGHAQKTISSTASNDSIPYDFTKVWIDIAGQKSAKVHHHEIVIPKEINGKPVQTGDYHFMVFCVDKAGNESYMTVKVKLSNINADEHTHEH